MFLETPYMTVLIRFFCVSLLALSLDAGQIVELQFLPNEIAEITTSLQAVQEVKFQDAISRFQSSQEVKVDLYLNEEDHQFDSLAKFPFHFTLVLKDAKFSGNKDGIVIPDLDINTIEKAEVNSLLNRPLKFILKDRNQSLELEGDQKKLFGDYQIFASRNFKGFLEEDIKDIFSLAGSSLKVGETFTFSKKLGLIEVPVIYSINEITPEFIRASFSEKVDRTKLPIELDESVIQATVAGEINGEILWNRKNNLYFSSSQKGHLDYKFKLEEKEFSIQLELNKTVVSSPKNHAN